MVPDTFSDRWFLLTLAAVLLVPAVSARAQKAPALGYVYPPAVMAGKSTDVQLGGFDFTRDMQWFVHDERVRLHVLGTPGEYHLPPPPYWVGPRTSTPALPIPREVPGRLDVPADVPEGLVRWQVANANGSSATAVFYVSRGAEVVESRSRDFPQRLPALPVAVSGRLSRLTEVDRYELVSPHDGPISLELMARRLGSGFLGALQVHDAAGRLLADFADPQGLDGGLTFAARAGETYTVSVHDVDFRGDRAYVYRLAAMAGPRVVATLPAAGQRGTTGEVEFVGWGVATGQAVLESIRTPVTFPTDPHLIAHTQRLETDSGTVEMVIPLSDVPEAVLAGDPAGTSARGGAPSPDAAGISVPGAVTVRLPMGVDEQRFTWNASQDESWSITAQSRAIGARLDVALSVMGPDGKVVSEVDDLPGTTDASLELRAPTSGQYTCVVRSLAAGTGARDELYRLAIHRAVPDFSLTVPQQVNVPSGGKVEVAVQVTRSGGFAGEVAISVEGLPAGVAPAGPWTVAAGKNEVKVTLQAAADAAVVATPIRFSGSAQPGNVPVTRIATALASGNLCPATPTQSRTPLVLLAMTMNPPFELLVVDRERQHDVPRGTTFLAELELVRKDGFAGEIQIEMAAQQARYRCGIRGPTVRVPPGVTRAVYPCFMPEWLGTELTRRMVVHGVAEVHDPRGTPRCLVKPGDARITMIMEGALMKLSCPAVEPTLRLGDSLELPLVISRSPKLPLPASVELVVPDEIAGLLRAEPLILPAGRDQGTLRITSLADPRLQGPWTLRVTATALQDGQWPVISETELPLVITRASE